MSQTNEIHPQLGRPPAPMSEEGTTGVPAADDRIDDQVAPSSTSDGVEDDVVVFADPEDDGLGLDAPVFEDEDAPRTADEEVVTAEYAVADEPREPREPRDAGDPAPADVPVTARAVPADDGTAVEDADVETPSDARPPAGAEAAAAAGGATAVAATTDRGDDAVAPSPAPAAQTDADTEYSIGHVFDQTNGVIEQVDGESDGTVDGEERSSADREGLNQPNPVGQQDAFRDDHYGADDGRDPNP